MPEQIYIGNFGKGLITSRLPFVIDNDAFPTMYNFYSWRGRAKRKRGTFTLGQLQIQEQSVATSTPPASWQIGQLGTFDGSGNISINLFSTTITNITQASNAVVTIDSERFRIGDSVIFSSVGGMTQINGKIAEVVSRTTTTITINLDTSAFTAYTSGGVVSLQTSGQTIVPTSIKLTDGTQTYSDLNANGTIQGSGISPATGTINYATGALRITGGTASQNLVGQASVTSFSYYPGLPVMGLRDLVATYIQANPLYPLLLAFDTEKAYQLNQNSSTVFFYNVTYYKGTNTPFSWNGDDFQQFWTTNYSSALWATNNVPGLHLVTGTYVSGSGSPTIVMTISGLGGTVLKAGTSSTGDYLWFNEWGSNTINGQTGYISNITGSDYTVTFPGNVTASASGKIQLLTASITGQDGIRWYDGDPTGGTGLPTGTGFGWVNFAPPLTAATVSIDTQPLGKYYLVGALAILPFKDRLLFFSPWIQTSSGAPVQLIDTVIWSWNGTPYYSSLVPTPISGGETFDPRAYYVDQTGLGGYLSAGISQPITTVSNNEDVLLIGFGGRGRKTRFVYTGNDFQPFLFYNINSELPSDATFSAVALDKGAIDIGIYGIALTDQQSSTRVDLQIPDSVFQIQASNNGVQRISGVRDFYREWIYFDYPVSNSPWKFPTQCFLFNYRDNTWAILYENFTCQGTYRKQQKYSWSTIPFRSWSTWQEAWNSGATTPQFPSIVGGTPQGYVLVKSQGTGEGVSGTISAIANSNGFTQITSINHCVSASNPNTGTGDYLLILGMLGATGINGMIGKVISTSDANTFVIDLPFPSGTYLGLGTFTRLSQPVLQTKQFNPYWEQGRQVRLSAQKYLMDFTPTSQITVNISLSQDPDDNWNSPQSNPPPNGLIYSQILFTCPESTNLGLTPANTNLQMPTAETQYQIWHRFNTSLIGDSFQVGFTLSDEQMRNLTFATAEVTLQGMHITIDKSSHLS